jgi:hypothetical protein
MLFPGGDKQGHTNPGTILAVAPMPRSLMSEPNPDVAPKIPLPISKELRTLAHDLSNSIETIMQACYLLSQAPLSDADKKWLSLIDEATRDAARINREIREVLRNQSQ